MTPPSELFAPPPSGYDLLDQLADVMDELNPLFLHYIDLRTGAIVSVLDVNLDPALARILRSMSLRGSRAEASTSAGTEVST